MPRAEPRRTRVLGRALLLPVAMVCCLSPIAAAQPLPALRIIEPKVTIHTTNAETNAPGTELAIGEAEVTVANDSRNDVLVELDVLAPATGTAATVSVTSEMCAVSALDVARCLVSIETVAPDETFVGQLIARADGLAAAVTALTVAPSRDLENPGWLVILSSLIVALLLTWVRVVVFPIPKLTPKAKMGPVNWKFSDSWASSLTAVGAVLGTILAAKVLPESGRYISDARFTALNLLFGGLVVLAPFVYAACRVPNRAGLPVQEDKDAPYLGFAVVFIVSTTITVWAVIGELGTLFIAVLEIANGPVALSDVVVWLLSLLLVGVAVLTLVYAFITIAWQIESKVVSEEKLARLDELTHRDPEQVSPAEKAEVQDLIDSVSASSWTPA